MAEQKIMRGGDSTGEGMVVVESGGGGLTEVRGEPPPPPPPKPAPEIAPVIPQPQFADMADRARSAIPPTPSKTQAAEQGA